MNLRKKLSLIILVSLCCFPVIVKASIYHEYRFDAAGNKYDIYTNSQTGEKTIKGISPRNLPFEFVVDRLGNMTGIDDRGHHWTYQMRDSLYFDLTAKTSSVGRPEVVRY
jgi:hypothetical protein